MFSSSRGQKHTTITGRGGERKDRQAQGVQSPKARALAGTHGPPSNPRSCPAPSRSSARLTQETPADECAAHGSGEARQRKKKGSGAGISDRREARDRLHGSRAIIPSEWTLHPMPSDLLWWAFFSPSPADDTPRYIRSSDAIYRYDQVE